MRQDAKRTSRRSFLQAAGAVGTGASATHHRSAFAAPAIARRQEADTIKMSMVAGYRAEQLQQEMLPVFESATGIKVTVDAMPYVALHEKMTVSLFGGAADWDVLYVDEGYIPQLAGFMEPLGPYIERDKYDLEDYFATTLEAGQWDGEQIALPHEPNVQILTFRRDVLEQVGAAEPPNTWSEVMDLGRQVRETLGPDMAGYTVVADREDLQISFNTIMFFWSFGTDVFDDAWQPIFNNDQGRQAVEYYRDLVEQTGLEGAQQFKFPDTISIMQAGDSAMAHVWASGVQEILAGADEAVSENIGVAVLPSNQSVKNPMRGTWTTGINASSQKKDQAWELVKWFCGEEGVRLYIDTGAGFGSRRSILASDDFRARFSFAEPLVESLELARARPLVPETQQILDALNLMGSKVITRQGEVQAALDEAEQAIRTVMERGGYYS